MDSTTTQQQPQPQQQQSQSQQQSTVNNTSHLIGNNLIHNHQFINMQTPNTDFNTNHHHHHHHLNLHQTSFYHQQPYYFPNHQQTPLNQSNAYLNSSTVATETAIKIKQQQQQQQQNGDVLGPLNGSIQQYPTPTLNNILQQPAKQSTLNKDDNNKLTSTSIVQNINENSTSSTTSSSSSSTKIHSIKDIIKINDTPESSSSSSSLSNNVPIITNNSIATPSAISSSSSSSSSSNNHNNNLHSRPSSVKSQFEAQNSPSSFNPHNHNQNMMPPPSPSPSPSPSLQKQLNTSTPPPQPPLQQQQQQQQLPLPPSPLIQQQNHHQFNSQQFQPHFHPEMTRFQFWNGTHSPNGQISPRYPFNNHQTHLDRPQTPQQTNKINKTNQQHNISVNDDDDDSKSKLNDSSLAQPSSPKSPSSSYHEEGEDTTMSSPNSTILQLSPKHTSSSSTTTTTTTTTATQNHSNNHNEKRSNGKDNSNDLFNKLKEMGTEVDRCKFADNLHSIWDEYQICHRNLPNISKSPLDLYKLYVMVRDKGGFDTCTKMKYWKELCNVLNVGQTANSAFNLKKRFVANGLFHYECKYDRGGIDPLPFINEMDKSTKNSIGPKPKNGTGEEKEKKLSKKSSKNPQQQQQQQQTSSNPQQPISNSNSGTNLNNISTVQHQNNTQQQHQHQPQFNAEQQQQQNYQQHIQMQAQQQHQQQMQYPHQQSNGMPQPPPPHMMNGPYGPFYPQQPPNQMIQQQGQMKFPMYQAHPQQLPPHQQQQQQPQQQVLNQPQIYPPNGMFVPPQTSQQQQLRPQMNPQTQQQTQVPPSYMNQPDQSHPHHQLQAQFRPNIPPTNQMYPPPPPQQQQQQNQQQQQQSPQPQGNFMYTPQRPPMASQRPPTPLSMPPRPPMTSQIVAPPQQIQQQHQQVPQSQQLISSSSASINKTFQFPADSIEAIQPNESKKRKLMSKDIIPCDPWRLYMCLKSGLLAESTYALDALNILLYDDNTIPYFHLKQFPGLVNILLNYFIKCLKILFKDEFNDFNDDDDYYDNEINLNEDEDVDDNNVYELLETTRSNKTIINNKRESKILEITFQDKECKKFYNFHKFSKLRKTDSNRLPNYQYKHKKISSHLQIHLNPLKEENELNIKTKKKCVFSNELDDPTPIEEETLFKRITSTQEELIRRCICISTIFRNLSFVPGNDIELCKNLLLLKLHTRLILFKHVHIKKNQQQEEKEGDNCFTVLDDHDDDDENWSNECVNYLRENTLVLFSNIATCLNLNNYLNDDDDNNNNNLMIKLFTKSIFHWCTCKSNDAIDTLNTMSETCLISAQKLSIEILSKMTINELNIELFINNNNSTQINLLFDLLSDYLTKRDDQTLREFAIVILNTITTKFDSIKTLNLARNCINFLGFIEDFEEQSKHLYMLHQQHQPHLPFTLSEETLGTSVDMLRRCANCLFNLTKQSDNLPFIAKYEDRLLELTMSNYLDLFVGQKIAQVLYYCTINK